MPKHTKARKHLTTVEKRNLTEIPHTINMNAERWHKAKLLAFHYKQSVSKTLGDLIEEDYEKQKHKILI